MKIKSLTRLNGSSVKIDILLKLYNTHRSYQLASQNYIAPILHRVCDIGAYLITKWEKIHDFNNIDQKAHIRHYGMAVNNMTQLQFIAHPKRQQQQ